MCVELITLPSSFASLRRMARGSVQHRQCNSQVVDTLLDYVTNVKFATAK